MKHNFLYLFLIFPVVLLAQQSDTVKTVLLDAYVYNMETNKPMPDVNIINTNKGTGTISDVDGFFSIRLQKGDTLYITAISFEEQKIFIEETATEDSYEIDIPMKAISYEMDPVDLVKGDWNNFKHQFLYEAHKNEQNKPLQVAGYELYPVIDLKPPMKGGPISMFHNVFGKEARKKRKLKKSKKKISDQNYIKP